jgi:allantoinase
VDLAVVGGQVFLADEFRNVTLGITDGKISYVTSDQLNADRTIELNGELVIPGLVDAHVHFREPGYVEKEGIRTGSRAAAAGGITTVVEMPNTTPPVTDLSRWEEKADLFKSKSHIDFALFGAITEDNLGTGDIANMAETGATAFKTFMSTSFGPLLMPDKGKLYQAFEEVAETGVPLYIHAEDEEYLDEFTRRVEESKTEGMEQFFNSRPPIAETTAVSDVIDIVRNTGTRTVIVHVTTAEAVDRIQEARSEGLPIHAEVTPYHLSLDQSDLMEIGTVGIGTPPVRSASNRDELQRRVDKAEFSLIGSDHAPHTLAEKNRDPLDVAPGMPQLETALGVLLDTAYRNKFTIKQIIQSYSEFPARQHGIYPQKGTLSIGSDADFVVIDPDRQWTVDPDEFESEANYSPFSGKELVGMPIQVFQRGQCVAEEMKVINDPGSGEHLT